MTNWTVSYRKSPALWTWHCADVHDAHGCLIGRAAHHTFEQAGEAALRDARRMAPFYCKHLCPKCHGMNTEQHDTFAGGVWECADCKTNWFAEQQQEAA